MINFSLPIVINLGDIEGLGFLSGPFSTKTIIEKFNDTISTILAFLTVIAALIFIFRFFIAGFSYMNAGGDKEAVKSAQQQLQNSIIGLVIVVVAYAIISIIGDFLGFKIFNMTDIIGTQINKLSP
jgi:uncharacterized membrane protein